MVADQFTAEDRRLVIEELEKIQQSKLVPFKSARKLLTDEKGMLYFLFGGTGNWHGIRPSTLEKLIEYHKEGAFVVAKKYRSRDVMSIGNLMSVASCYP